MRCHFTTCRICTIKKDKKEQWLVSMSALVGMQIGAIHYGKQYGSSFKKIQRELPYAQNFPSQASAIGEP